MKNNNGSFRDPSGFVFEEKGVVYRQINSCYFFEYEKLIGCGLLRKLIDENLLIPHEEVEATESYKVIRPSKIPFISYPYEWSFSQLQNAALLTLKIQEEVIKQGFTLKDASAYNIQFLGHQPIFIDTLSFESYQEGSPWVAFSQFCSHFLYPLLLMSKVDLRLNSLFKVWLDGIPMDLANELMPASSYFSIESWLYLKLPLLLQKKHQHRKKRVSTNLSKKQLLKLIDGLIHTIKALSPKKSRTEWGEYYTFTNYSDKAFAHKEKLVQEFIKIVDPKSVWDLGANDGRFSRLASDKKIMTLSFDLDPVAVEKNYQKACEKKETHILPLIIDLTNPSNAIGWGHSERMSLEERGPADLGLVLALVHHLAIGNNVPFEKIAYYFSRLFRYLIIEFVPKEDSKVQELLCNRKDVFLEYTQEMFEEKFSSYFKSIQKQSLVGSSRTLYLMKNFK